MSTNQTESGVRVRAIETNIKPLPPINIKHCHTKPDQIAADHSYLTLCFSHLINIKPLPPINIKPLPHEAWSNCRRSTRLFLVVWLVGFRLGRWWFGFRIEWVSAWMGFWCWMIFWSFVVLILNGLPIEVVMMMVVGSERKRETMKKIIKKW